MAKRKLLVTPPELAFSPPGTLRFGSLPRLLETLPDLAKGGGIRLDLRDLRWIEALPIAVMTTFLRHHLVKNPHASNLLHTPPKYEYLQRMDFFRALGVLESERFTRKDSAGRFIPVTQVQTGGHVHRIAEEVVATLRVHDPEAAQVLRHCIGEIVDNAFVHAGSKPFLCAQHFPNACRTQVGIADAGIGFLQSFTAAEDYAELSLSHRDALTLGLSPHVTSKPDSSPVPYSTDYGRLGLGLFIVSEVLARIGGKMVVASGDALFKLMPSGRRVWAKVAPWNGAIVGFEVPDEPLVEYRDALREAREMADKVLS